MLLQLRIGQEKVRRGENVEDLPCRKLDRTLVLLTHAAHAGRSIVPPPLLEQKCLVDQIVGPPLPSLARETPVLREGLNARFRGSATCAFPDVMNQARGLTDTLLNQLHLLSRRCYQMRCPI